MNLILKLNIFILLLSLYYVDSGVLNNNNNEQSKSSPETNEQQFHTPLVLHVDGDKYEFPTTVEVNGNQPIFSYEKDSKHIKYYCPPEEEDLIAYVNEYSSEDPYRRYCLFEITPTTDKPGCLNKVQSFIAPPIIDNQFTPELLSCGPLHVVNKSHMYGIQFMLCERPGIFRKLFLGMQTLDDPQKRKSKVMQIFCYNTDKQKIIYHSYMLLSSGLLNKAGVMRDYAIYDSNDQLSINGFGVFGNWFENKAQEYTEELQRLNAQPNNEHKLLHMIIPPNHMPFGTWKQTLYHCYNVTIMPKHSTAKLTVAMAAFAFGGVNTWYKIIHDFNSRQGIVILVFENLTQDIKCHTNTPSKTLCDFKSWLGAEDVQTELALCCYLNESTLRLFGLYFTVDGLLDLNYGPDIKLMTNSMSITDATKLDLVDVENDRDSGLPNRGKDKLPQQPNITTEMSIASTSKDA